MLLAAMRIAVSGVRRSCPSDASSAVFSCSLCRVSSPALRSSRNCARSIAIATTPASVSRVPASTGRPAAARRPIGLVPTRSGTSRTDLPVDRHRPVAGVGARVGVELERGLRRRERVRQLATVQRDRARAGFVHVPVVRRAAGRWRRTRDRTGGRSTAPAPRAPRGCRSSCSTSRLRSNSRASSSRRPTASCVRARATADRLLATRLTARKANSATQFWGSAIVNVPTGGRKKKLRQSIAATEVATATHSRDVAATTSTTSRKSSRRSPRSRRAATARASASPPPARRLRQRRATNPPLPATPSPSWLFVHAVTLLARRSSCARAPSARPASPSR